MNELDKLNAERQAAHEHAQAERMQRATTVRPKPKGRWRLIAATVVVVLGVTAAATRADAWPVAGLRWGDRAGTAAGTAIVATPGSVGSAKGTALVARARWIFGQSCLDSFTLPNIGGNYVLYAADVMRSCSYNPYGLSVVSLGYRANGTPRIFTYSIVLQANGVTHHDFWTGAPACWPADMPPGPNPVCPIGGW